MKRLFYIITLFFTLAFSLLIESSALQTQPIDFINSIKNTEKEELVLISNNLFAGEITSRNTRNNQIFFGSSPLLLSHQTSNNLFGKDKSKLNGYLIYNLKTEKQKIHQIRAP